MLQLVLGAAGTGKTESLYVKIREAVQAGEQVIFLVPEQASFESERQLYRRVGAEAALKVEVLSFTRLCHRVFCTYGNLAGIHLEESAKLLLMSVAMEGVRDSLQVYRQDVQVPLIKSMCDIVHEMKGAGITASKLKEAAALQETDEARGKLYDISLLMEAYHALLEQGYDDSDDHLVRAVKQLQGSDFFRNTHVFLDGFTALMGAEWGMLRAVLDGGARVTAALCCENLGETNGVFGASCETARKLVRIAEQSGVTVMPPIKLASQYRFAASGIAAVAEAFPQISPEKVEDTDGVYLLACEDIYDEVEIVASQIAALVRGGYRYRDIVVITRDTTPYQTALETVFLRYEIPYFNDQRVNAAAFPLMRGVLCALDAVQSGFDSEYVMALAKCGLIGITVEQAGCLENYCYVWNVTGKTWRAPFQNHPDGLKTTMSDDACTRLQLAEDGRLLLMDGLFLLEDELAECDGKQFAKAIYHYLECVHAVEHLHVMAATMTSEEEKTFLEEGAQIWDALMDVLDVFGGVLADMRYTPNRFIELMRICVDDLQIGMVPQTLDQVLVGGADRIRPNDPRAVFVIGLNEGRFPAGYSNGGLLTNREREHLREAGVDLLHTAEQQSALESYYIYYALTRASEKLYLSWPGRDTAGRGLVKSSAVDQVERICKVGVRHSAEIPALERIGNVKSALDFVARGWRIGTEEQLMLREWLNTCAPETYALYERISNMHPYRLETSEARRIFAGEIRLSTTRLDKYSMCPFSFFCESGLKLRIRRKAEFNPLEAGNIVHYILQEMVKKYGGKGLFDICSDDLRRESAVLLQQAMQERLQGKEMPRRFQYLFSRQVDILVVLLRHLGQEFSQSAFVPAEIELEIRPEAPCKPLTLQAADGSPITIEGVVDRLDLYETQGKRFLRVVDYKTGIKKFDLADVCQGRNLQMLIYLFSLCDSYGGDTAWRNLPAGVLYMPARAGMLYAKRDVTGDALESMRDSELKMNGLLIDEPEALKAMEPEMKGRFIPAKVTAKGILDSRSTVVSPSQFAAVRRAVEQQLEDMVNRMKDGDVEALPMAQEDQSDDKSVCEICDFSMVCLHEPDDPFRKIPKLSWEAALELLSAEKEGEDGTASVDTTTKTSD